MIGEILAGLIAGFLLLFAAFGEWFDACDRKGDWRRLQRRLMLAAEDVARHHYPREWWDH